MNTTLTALQLLGFVAVLLGVALLLPLGFSLIVNGALVLAAATVAEALVTRAQHGQRKAGAAD